jgi:hypothetical protein
MRVAEAISNVLKQFNGREQAAAIWLLVALVAALFNKGIRGAILAFVRSLFARRLIWIYTSATLWFVAIVVVLEKTGMWNSLLIKDTVMWFVGTAFVLIFNVNNAKEHFFRDAVVDNLKLTALLEFVSNIYSFNVWIELPLTLVIFSFSMVGEVASKKPEYVPVKRLIEGVLSFIGWAMLAFVVYKSISNFSELATWDTARSLVLPLILTIAFIPYVYALALQLAYEVVFFRVDFALRDNRPLARFARERLSKLCSNSVARVKRVTDSSEFDPWNLKSRKEVLDMIDRLKRNEFRESRSVSS